MFSPAFHKWFSRDARTTQRTNRSSQADRNRRRPAFESLEDRTLLSVNVLNKFPTIPDLDGLHPPDTQMAVGKNHVIVAVNTSIAFYNKSDGAQTLLQPFTQFFAPLNPVPNFSDPIVYYDESVDRFIVGILDFDFASISNFDFAISNTGDPNDGFSKMKAINVNDAQNGQPGFGFADYPKFGITPSAYVVTFNIFQDLAAFTDVETLVIDRAKALDPSPAVFQTFTSDVPGGSSQMTLSPASVHIDPANPPPAEPVYFVSEAGPGNGRNMRITQMTNVLSANPTYTFTDVPVNRYSPVVPPVDPGGVITAQIDNRIFSANMRGNLIVAAHNAGNGSVTQARWYEFDVTDLQRPVQQGAINRGNGVFTTYPSVDINANGDIGMSFIESSASEPMSMYVVGRTALDAPNTMQTPALVAAGVGASFDFREGDYSGIGIDPIDGTFWAANEWNPVVGDWGTFTANFDITPITTITGRVYNDVIGNGQRDLPGDLGVAGFTVYFDLNDNNQLDANEPRVVTDNTGVYSFTNILAGTYNVRLVSQAAFNSTTSDLVVTVAAGKVSSGNDFGIFKKGSISATVYLDDNSNGVQDPGEGGAIGWTIQLIDANTNAILASKVTNSQGQVTFAGLGPKVGDLGPKNFRVRQVVKSGWAQKTSDPADISPFVSGQVSSANTFAVFQGGIITGTVFTDNNGNRSKDPTDLGLSNITVQLLNPITGAVIATQSTDASGNFTFTTTSTGTFRVREVLPAGSIQTTANPGDFSVRTSGAQVLGILIGNFVLGSVTGQVSTDVLGSGTPGTQGIPGIIVQLLDAGTNNVLQTQVTDLSGSYSFTRLTVGNYKVVETLPPGFIQTTANPPVLVVDRSGLTTVSGPYDIGAFQLISFSGQSFIDPTGTGFPPPPLVGIAGRTIQLFDATNPNKAPLAQQTDAGGNFSFPNVMPGKYLIREVLPSGFVHTTTDPGPITAMSGANATAAFGSLQLSTISGSVFEDLNGDATRQTGDPGVQAVTVQLLDSSNTLITSTQTDASGAYSFGGLGIGTYRIRIVAVSGATLTTQLPNDITIAASGLTIANTNFGLFRSGAVSGRVFSDLAGDGALNGNDAGLANVGIQLLDSSNALVQSTNTDGGGNFSFSSLAAGAYHIRQSVPSGNIQTTGNPADFTIQSGSNATVTSIGDFQLVSVTARAFEDQNGNGVSDATDPGLAGVTFQLVNTRTSAVVGTQTSGANGSVVFSSVGPGNFVVRQQLPAGSQQTTANPPAFATSSGTNVSSGLNFGDFKTISIQGRAFEDRDADGTDTNGSDPGAANYVVQLFRDANKNGQIDDSDRLLSSIGTDLSGRYSFSNQGPGNYLVREVKQSQRIQTSPNGGVYKVSATSGLTVNGDDFGNISDPNRAFVYQAYLDLFGRRVDQSGFDFWGTKLGQGLSRTAFITAMQNSVEYRSNQVQGLYRGLLGRSADATGLRDAVNLLMNTRIVGGADDPILQLKANILGSAEYFQRHGGTNLGFLQGLYNDVLGRALDATGASVFGAALAGGSSRTLIAKTILYSTEALQNFVASQYTLYLRRPGDAGGINTFVNRLRNGATFDSVTLAFLTSDEYFFRI